MWRRRAFARGPSNPPAVLLGYPEPSCRRKFTATRSTLLNSARPTPGLLPTHPDAPRLHQCAAISARTFKMRSIKLFAKLHRCTWPAASLVLLEFVIKFSIFDSLRNNLLAVYAMFVSESKNFKYNYKISLQFRSIIYNSTIYIYFY